MDEVLTLGKGGVAILPIPTDRQNLSARLLNRDNVGQFKAVFVFKARKVKIDAHLKDCVSRIVRNRGGLALYLIVLFL